MTSLRAMGTLATLPAFRNAYLLRGLGVWVLFRMFLAFLGTSDPGVLSEIYLLGTAALAVVLDARRRREDLFLGNLTIPPWIIGVWALPLALLAELLVP